MTINLDSLSIAQLEELKQNATAMVELKRDQAIHHAREQIRKIAADVGMSVEELMGLKKSSSAKNGGASKAAGLKVAAKYRNPKNPLETWSGRGRKPVWLQAELDKGNKLETFAI